MSIEAHILESNFKKYIKNGGAKFCNIEFDKYLINLNFMV